MRNDFDRALSEAGITRSQWGMIVVVARHPGATQRTIAEALEMSEASAGRLIDRLCCEGLLERRERDDDRRARAVYLTAAAEPLLNQSAEIARDFTRAIFAGMDRAELDRLQNLLGRLYDNLNRERTRAPSNEAGRRRQAPPPPLNRN
jgi:MarR family transcriptional regulator, transcriptional regulator for hemolysin